MYRPPTIPFCTATAQPEKPAVGSASSIYSLASARLPNRESYHTVAQHQHGASTHMPTNLWQPGVSGNPAGRLRGSRNALSEEVICALLRDFRQHGQKAVARVRRTQPAAYLKILALLVPREMKVEHTGGVKAMTDEQLEAGIEAITAMLAARDPANAKVIDAVAEPVAEARKVRRKRRKTDDHMVTSMGNEPEPVNS
jgi:hypothetical protein